MAIIQHKQDQEGSKLLHAMHQIDFANFIAVQLLHNLLCVCVFLYVVHAVSRHKMIIYTIQLICI